MLRLHAGLLRAGVDSTVLVKNKLNSDPGVIDGIRPTSRLQRLWRRVATELDSMPTRLLKTDNTAGLSPGWVPSTVPRLVDSIPSDIVHMHWICDGFLNPRSIARLRKPLVWNSYDMWPICGAEHYAGDSQRHIEGYTRSNRTSGESGFDVNRWVWQRKVKAWRNLDVTMVVATRWLAEHFRRSVLFKHKRIEIIAHGVDHRVFKPVDQKFSREALNLPQGKRLILFGASGSMSNRRKGGHLLADSLRQLATQGYARDTELVIFGATKPEADSDLGVKVHHLGALDSISVCLAYNAADVFVAPSLEDNLPLTVLEALSCRTPVVAFDIGGVLDILAHRDNSYLAKSFDTADLAAGLAWMLEDKARREALGMAGRRLVEERFQVDYLAGRYVELYRDILAR
jgi:glycosyltransferase involved in cell wall biosynthesis